MKDPNYVMRLMVTGGRLLVDDTCMETVRRWQENGEDVVRRFKCKMSFDWHFFNLHAVDDHTNLRHELPSI